MRSRLLSLSVVLVLTASFAVAAPAVPDKALPIKGSKKTVMFPHSAHAASACVDCHHAVHGEESYAPCASSGCHDDIQAKQGERSLYRVVHFKKADMKHATCLSCHSKQAAEQPERKTALTACAKSSCHP